MSCLLSGVPKASGKPHNRSAPTLSFISLHSAYCHVLWDTGAGLGGTEDQTMHFNCISPRRADKWLQRVPAKKPPMEITLIQKVQANGRKSVGQTAVCSSLKAFISHFTMLKTTMNGISYTRYCLLK